MQRKEDQHAGAGNDESHTQMSSHSSGHADPGQERGIRCHADGALRHQDECDTGKEKACDLRDAAHRRPWAVGPARCEPALAA